MKAYYLLPFSFLLLACSDGFEATNTTSFSNDEVLDASTSNKAPIIACDIYKNSDPIVWRQVHTNSDLDTFGDNLKEGDQIAIDCSATEDEKGFEKVKMEIDRDYQPDLPNFQIFQGATFNLISSEVGRKTFALKASDEEGLERLKTFTLITECRNAQSPVVDANGIQVNPGSKLNHFNYSIATSAVSGGSEFEYSWDFNGDGSFDPISLDAPEIWTSQNSLQDIYSIYVTDGQTRNITLKVKNECELETNVVISRSFDNFNIARSPSAQAVIKPYWYIQSDIAAVNHNQNQRNTADLLLTQYPEDEPLKRMECDYKKTRFDSNAVFTMKAYNKYKDNNIYQHGHLLKIEDIEDNLTSGTQVIQNLRLSGLNYLASEIDDAMSQEIYERNQDCQVSLRVIRSQGVTPCAADEDDKADFIENSEAIIILGEFDCPSLRNASNGNVIEARNGKFFCEVAPSNQCVGGGGGGGGLPPPQQ